MKSLKSIFLLSMLLFCGAGCSDESTVDEWYGCDMYSFAGDAFDWIRVRNYLSEQGLIQQFELTGKSESELDKKAIERYEQYVKKIDENAIKALITKDFSLTYGLRKASSGEDAPLLREKTFDLKASN
ncbi:MAG: hypothetical protein LBO74_17525 [Candidatus Symbiothrix sp.]|jgi:hypothetical protein|nr:hypothetical protein [Candidatus Symbiothrix sp.]